MLIRFSVENFKSFHGKQTFSMEADEGVTDLPGNTVVTPAGTLVKTAAVYGHNASGKTNLIAAMEALREIVLGTRGRRPVDRLSGLDAFALAGGATAVTAVAFETELLLGECVFQYRLVAEPAAIVEETLRIDRGNGGGSAADWFEVFHRTGPDVKFHSEEAFGSGEKKRLLVETLHERTSLLHHATNLRTSLAADLYAWFAKRLRLHRWPDGALANDWAVALREKLLDRLETDDAFATRFRKLAADADLGVVAFERVNPTLDDIPHARLIGLAEEAKRAGQTLDAVVDRHLEEFGSPTLRLRHRTVDGADAALPWDTESSGTRRFIRLLAMLLLYDDGPARTIVIDELEHSLSPDLLDRLVRLFHDPEVNRSASQLIFTTHDRSLMDAKRLLRRDQVWITQKGDDGATELYSLADFDEGEAPEHSISSRRFATGRYGGVAEFGRSLETLLPADQPQELPEAKRGEA